MDTCFFLAYCERRKLGVTFQFTLIDIRIYCHYAHHGRSLPPDLAAFPWSEIFSRFATRLLIS